MPADHVLLAYVDIVLVVTVARPFLSYQLRLFRRDDRVHRFVLDQQLRILEADGL